MTEQENTTSFSRRINTIFIRRTGLVLTGLGMLIFLLGAVPGWFGLDNSEAVGFVQVGVFSLGLLLICLGGSFALGSLWPRHWRSIAADIGLRVAWSGWVLAVIAAMADVFGLGTRPLSISFTFFGPWQAFGVMVGQVVILVGFLMMIPYQKEFPPPPGEEHAEETPEDEEEPEGISAAESFANPEDEKPVIVIEE